MQWMRDRDLLVEDTLAFVQRLAANKPAWIETPTRVEQPIAVASEQTAKPRDRIFEREEILQRVADFRANQRKFQREREEHYKSTMAEVRWPMRQVSNTHEDCVPVLRTFARVNDERPPYAVS